MFNKSKNIKKSAKSIDKIITTVIIWSAVAGVFGLSQTKKWKKVTSDVKTKVTPIFWNIFKKWLASFWKWLAFWVSLFSKKKK